MSYPVPPYGTMPPVPAHEQAAVYEWVDDVFAQQGKLATDVDRVYWFGVLAGEAKWDFGYIYGRMIEGQHAGVDPRTPPPTPPPVEPVDPPALDLGLLDQAFALLKDIQATEQQIAASLVLINAALAKGYTNKLLGDIRPKG